MKFDDDNEKNIFYLGLVILFAWMIVIILCASPQLFRDFIQRHFCCCLTKGKNAESLKEAHERMLSANESFLTVALPKNPSNILLKQAIGDNNHLIVDLPDMIVEESRCSSVQTRLSTDKDSVYAINVEINRPTVSQHVADTTEQSATVR